MEGSWIAAIVLLVLGGGAACAVYEVLVRRFAPQRTGRVKMGEVPVGDRPRTACGDPGAREGTGNARLRADERSGTAQRRAAARSGSARRQAEASRSLSGVRIHGLAGAWRALAAACGARGRFLGAATKRVERLLPMTRADGDAYRAEIARAGWSIEPETWRVLRIVAATGCGALAGVGAVAAGAVPIAALAVVGTAAVAGWTAPRLAIAQAAARRRQAIEAQLPDAMELLGIAIAAGSPVEQSFREVAQNLRPPLSGEFEAVDREVNLLGHSREQALDHLAARCASRSCPSCPPSASRDVSAFVAQLAQAVSQGSSIAEGLSSQAALARETAQAAALERIRKMPTKLDVVLSFCFLPPTIALVVVPTVVDLLKFLNDTLQ